MGGGGAHEAVAAVAPVGGGTGGGRGGGGGGRGGRSHRSRPSFVWCVSDLPGNHRAQEGMDIVFGLLLLTSPPLPAVVVVEGVGCRGSAARPQQQQEEEERNGVVVGDWAEERRRRGEERRGNASRGGRGVEKGIERALCPSCVPSWQLALLPHAVILPNHAHFLISSLPLSFFFLFFFLLQISNTRLPD